jgi:hypothetical protein
LAKMAVISVPTRYKMTVKEAGTPGVLKMVSCYFSLNLLTKSTIEFCHGDLELSSFRTGEGAGTQERERERERDLI